MADPADAVPRISGIRSFARRPHGPELDGVDVAVIGVPFDGGASFRTGARFGPEAIRSASTLLREYDPALGIATLEALRIVDRGDVAITPGSSQRAVGEIAEQLIAPHEAGTVPLLLGGDHTISLAGLRAAAGRRGPLALVLLDAHADTWDSYRGERYLHGTPFRRAVEEELVDPERSLIAGTRGSLYSAADLDDARGLGFELVPWQELAALGAAAYGERVRERVAGAPAYLSFDVDFVDPAFAPATGTPEVGGPTSAEALAFLRSLAGAIQPVGMDVVELSPPYDGPGQVSALLAANVAYAMCGILALARS